ncbi:P-type ATPase, A domain superfamily [Sesbania bispinosa]|nr:P-type ATPase, A domain superfamily [Sesbania bispinosa]
MSSAGGDDDLGASLILTSKIDVARIVKEQDFESLLEIGGVDRVCAILQSQRQHSEIDYRNLGVLGNPVPVYGTSFSSFLLNSWKQNRYTISMLLISAAFSFATEFKQEGPKYGWHDGVAIVSAVLMLIVFSSMTNFWRQRQMMKLAKRRGKLEFTVQRDGECTKVALSDIVVGDMVCLRKGDEVPADGLLVSGESGDILVLAEAMKSKIDCKRNPFLMAGSKVIEGNGRMLVAASVAYKDCNNPEKRGLLESQIEKPISYIDKAALFISTLVALVVFIRLMCKKNVDSGGLPEMKGNVSVGLVMEVLERIFLRPQGRISILTGLVTVVILCVQHGVPLMVTISLKYQIDKVVSDQEAVLNDLSACTTMGLVTVICIDVSGGLISKPMEVSRIWMGETDISKVEGSKSDPETTWEMNIKSLTQEYDILKHRKLNSDKEGRGVLVRKFEGNGQVLHLHWSGTASTILDMCSQYYDSKGECHAMKNQKIKFGQVIKDMEDSGLEPIAFAYRQTHEEELEQDELILLGLIGLKYTCQEPTKLALENLRNTGIQIKLVSENDIMLVKDIASELGIDVTVDGIMLEGKEFQDLNGNVRSDKVDPALVMGSFRPEDKLLMVQCLQDKGHVVAFVGRRLSHTSVLKVADVGIVHNSKSRIVDRESAGISIKCFSALKPIVRAGRSNYHNIQKFIQLQLTFTISGSLITLITTIFTGESPLTAIQLIWVNVLMCLLGSLMMVMELSSQEELDKKPSDRNQPITTKVLVIEYAKGLADCMRLNATQWAICVLFGALPWVFEWALKILPPILSTNCASESNTSTTLQNWFYHSWSFPSMMLLLFPVGLI